MWHLPRLGIEPMSFALAGGFLSTVPPEKSEIMLFATTWMGLEIIILSEVSQTSMISLIYVI